MQLKLVGEAVVDADERPDFESFWLLYPKKVAKFKANEIWRRLSEKDQLDATVAIVAWRQVWLRRGEMEFVPHASTWLYQHRWEDELPDQWAASHASHAPAAIPLNERAVMPDHVKALIAKLKGGK